MGMHIDSGIIDSVSGSSFALFLRPLPTKRLLQIESACQHHHLSGRDPHPVHNQHCVFASAINSHIRPDSPSDRSYERCPAPHDPSVPPQGVSLRRLAEEHPQRPAL